MPAPTQARLAASARNSTLRCSNTVLISSAGGSLRHSIRASWSSILPCGSRKEMEQVIDETG